MHIFKLDLVFWFMSLNLSTEYFMWEVTPLLLGIIHQTFLTGLLAECALNALDKPGTVIWVWVDPFHDAETLIFLQICKQKGNMREEWLYYEWFLVTVPVS